LTFQRYRRGGHSASEDGYWFAKVGKTSSTEEK